LLPDAPTAMIVERLVEAEAGFRAHGSLKYAT